MIRVNVDPTNPGQFFACCGLLELADRLWPGAEGWFEKHGSEFCMKCGGDLPALIRAIARAELKQLDLEDKTASPIEIGKPFRSLRLDWWNDEVAGGAALKVWAGSMSSFGIARAMQHAMRSEAFCLPGLLNIGMVVPDPDDPQKKKEPFYFDARRCPNSHSRDVGFSPNDLGMTTTAFPAVELLCLVGLQRCRPAKTSKARIFDYSVWTVAAAPEIAAGIVPGIVRLPGSLTFRFESWFRTGQRKHKAFRSASLLSQGV